MKVWELIARLEEATAGSVVSIGVPDKATKAKIEEGLDADYCLIDNESGVVTIHAKVSA